MDKFKDISNEDLQTKFSEVSKALQDLLDIEAPTIAQVEEASALDAERDEVKGEMEAREALAAEAAEKFNSMRTKFAAKKDKGTEQPDDAAEREVAYDDDAPRKEVKVADHEAAERAQVPDPDNLIDPNAPDEVEGDPEDEQKRLDEQAKKDAPGAPQSTARSRSVVTLARKTKRPEVPARDRGTISLTAAADVPGFPVSAKIDGLEDLAKAVIAKTEGFTAPNGDGRTEDIRKFPVASIRREFAPEFTVNQRDSEEAQMEVLNRAAKEERLPGGSLVAAGGWCAPSETMYDLCEGLESLEGLVSLPEVNVARGGINYTTGPDFSTFYGTADGFWTQTETQAIAGATKPCVTVACPAFQEVRMEAMGLCIKIPILTNATWPELIQRYVSGFLTAYQHRLSAYTITKVLALSPAARPVNGLGSTVTDAFTAMALIADQRREKYRMAFTSTLEVWLPFWVKGAMLADLSARTGHQGMAAESELNAMFSARGLNPQWLYNWQPLPTADVGGTATIREDTSYPLTYNALMFPAGTFIKGTKDVINLSTIYDAASLAVNVYTGLFMEEGMLIAKMCNNSDLLTLPVCNAGRTGAANLTCP